MSGDKKVRLEVAKGKFEDVDVKKVVKQVHDADINVMANYIYGLPGDDKETIQKTFELSLGYVQQAGTLMQQWLYQVVCYTKKQAIKV